MSKKTKEEISQEISNANLEIQKSLQDKEDDRDFKNPYGEVESPHPDRWNNNNG